MKRTALDEAIAAALPYKPRCKQAVTETERRLPSRGGFFHTILNQAVLLDSTEAVVAVPSQHLEAARVLRAILRILLREAPEVFNRVVTAFLTADRRIQKALQKEAVLFARSRWLVVRIKSKTDAVEAVCRTGAAVVLAGDEAYLLAAGDTILPCVEKLRQRGVEAEPITRGRLRLLSAVKDEDLMKWILRDAYRIGV